METLEKIKFITQEIISQNEPWLADLFTDFDWQFEDHWNQRSFPNLFIVTILVLPDKFINYSNFIEKAALIIKKTIESSSSILIYKLELKPDYSKIEIHNTKIEVVKTEWGEINDLQGKLISSLNQSYESIDYQNIGNTSRTIMDKLARGVFDPKKHVPKDSSMDVSNGKFKNQLQAYVASELGGKKNKPLRVLAESAINYTLNSIDLMNITTHKLNAEKHFAEICVMSTINIIGLIKAITELNGNSL